VQHRHADPAQQPPHAPVSSPPTPHTYSSRPNAIQTRNQNTKTEADPSTPTQPVSPAHAHPTQPNFSLPRPPLLLSPPLPCSSNSNNGSRSRPCRKRGSFRVTHAGTRQDCSAVVAGTEIWHMRYTIGRPRNGSGGESDIHSTPPRVLAGW